MQQGNLLERTGLLKQFDQASNSPIPGTDAFGGRVAVMHLHQRLQVQKRPEERKDGVHPTGAAQELECIQGGEDADPRDQVFQHGQDLAQRTSRFRSLGGSQHLEAGAEAQLARVESGHRDRVGFRRGPGGDGVDRAQLDRDVDGQDLRGIFGGQLLIHLAEGLRSGRGGGGGGVEVRQALVELLAAELDTIPERLFAHMNVHRDDRDAMSFNQLPRQIAGAVGDDSKGHDVISG